MTERRHSDHASRHAQVFPPPSFPTHNSPRVWLIAQALSPLAVRLIRLLLAHGDYVAACLPPKDAADEGYSADFRELVSECRDAGNGGRLKDREGWKDRIRTIRCDGRFSGDVTGAVAQAIHIFGRIDILLCNASFTAVGSVEEAALLPEEGEGAGAGLGEGPLPPPELTPAPELMMDTPGVEGDGGSYGDGSGTDSAGSSTYNSPSYWSVLLHSSPGNSLFRAQFAHTFFTNVNFIKAVLPQLRAQQNGHILALSSIGGHIGTPGMPIHTAATWALDGYCDSLAYEVAPFNVRVTVVQPQTEVQILNNKIAFAPILADYAESQTAAPVAHDNAPPPPPAPSARALMTRILRGGTAAPATDPAGNFYPPKLPDAALDRLVLETVHALAALGGHENPPARHIVGFEASAAVQEKLKIVSEELEDVVEASLAVDIFDSELNAEARRRKPEQPLPAV